MKLDRSTQTIAARVTRSYRVRQLLDVERRITGSDRVPAIVIDDDHVAGQPIPAGTRVEVIRYANAGQRGIEVTAVLPSGDQVHGLSAGNLRVVLA